MEHGGHFPFLWLFSSKLEIRKREIAEQMGEYSAVGESDFISFYEIILNFYEGWPSVTSIRIESYCFDKSF